MISSRRLRPILIPLAAVAIVFAAVASPPDSEPVFTERISLTSNTVTVADLVGEVHVQGHSGAGFEVEVRVNGSDASRDNVKVEVRKGEPAEVFVRFPLDQHSRYVYPRLGAGSSSSFSSDRYRGTAKDGGWLERWFSGWTGGTIKVSGSGSGAEIWADITVKVPKGKRLNVEHGVGSITAEGVEGDLSLDLSSGGVQASRVTGALSVDTGSGSVAVSHGRGTLSIDTGSGPVEVRNCEGASVAVDTGSGSVELAAIAAGKLDIDTGSGGIHGSELDAEAAKMDTGSGSIHLGFTRLGKGPFSLETGSGSIRMEVPPDISARLDASTGSGGIDVDVEGAEILNRERNSLEARLGRGEAHLELQTGSGSIRIARAH